MERSGAATAVTSSSAATLLTPPDVHVHDGAASPSGFSSSAGATAATVAAGPAVPRLEWRNVHTLLHAVGAANHDPSSSVSPNRGQRRQSVQSAGTGRRRQSAATSRRGSTATATVAAHLPLQQEEQVYAFCTNCRDDGHNRAECPAPLRCYVCLQPGHEAYICVANPAPGSCAFIAEARCGHCREPGHHTEKCKAIGGAHHGRPGTQHAKASAYHKPLVVHVGSDAGPTASEQQESRRAVAAALPRESQHRFNSGVMSDGELFSEGLKRLGELNDAIAATAASANAAWSSSRARVAKDTGQAFMSVSSKDIAAASHRGAASTPMALQRDALHRGLLTLRSTAAALLIAASRPKPGASEGGAAALHHDGTSGGGDHGGGKGPSDYQPSIHELRTSQLDFHVVFGGRVERYRRTLADTVTTVKETEAKLEQDVLGTKVYESAEILSEWPYKPGDEDRMRARRRREREAEEARSAQTALTARRTDTVVDGGNGISVEGVDVKSKLHALCVALDAAEDSVAQTGRNQSSITEDIAFSPRATHGDSSLPLWSSTNFGANVVSPHRQQQQHSVLGAVAAGAGPLSPKARVRPVDMGAVTAPPPRGANTAVGPPFATTITGAPQPVAPTAATSQRLSPPRGGGSDATARRPQASPRANATAPAVLSTGVTAPKKPAAPPTALLNQRVVLASRLRRQWSDAAGDRGTASDVLKGAVGDTPSVQSGGTPSGGGAASSARSATVDHHHNSAAAPAGGGGPADRQQDLRRHLESGDCRSIGSKFPVDRSQQGNGWRTAAARGWSAQRRADAPPAATTAAATATPRRHERPTTAGVPLPPPASTTFVTEASEATPSPPSAQSYPRGVPTPHAPTPQQAPASPSPPPTTTSRSGGGGEGVKNWAVYAALNGDAAREALCVGRGGTQELTAAADGDEKKDEDHVQRWKGQFMRAKLVADFATMVALDVRKAHRAVVQQSPRAMAIVAEAALTRAQHWHVAHVARNTPRSRTQLEAEGDASRQRPQPFDREQSATPRGRRGDTDEVVAQLVAAPDAQCSSLWSAHCLSMAMEEVAGQVCRGIKDDVMKYLDRAKGPRGEEAVAIVAAFVSVIDTYDGMQSRPGAASTSAPAGAGAGGAAFPRDNSEVIDPSASSALLSRKSKSVVTSSADSARDAFDSVDADRVYRWTLERAFKKRAALASSNGPRSLEAIRLLQLIRAVLDDAARGTHV